MNTLTEQQQSWLEDLVIKGRTTTTVKIINDLVTIELVSMTGNTQLTAEKSLTNLEGSSLYVLHVFAINSLAQSLLSYTTKEQAVKFESPEQALDFIKSRPSTVIDAMIQAHSTFEKEIKALLTPEKLTENFTKTPETVDASNSTLKV
jgi:hypothetical protein